MLTIVYQALINNGAHSALPMINAFPGSPRQPVNYIVGLSGIFACHRITQNWVTLNRPTQDFDTLNFICGRSRSGERKIAGTSKDEERNDVTYSVALIPALLTSTRPCDMSPSVRFSPDVSLPRYTQPYSLPDPGT